MAFVITVKVAVMAVIVKTLIAIVVTIAICAKSANNVIVTDVMAVICAIYVMRAIYVIAFVLSSKYVNDLVCFNGY